MGAKTECYDNSHYGLHDLHAATDVPPWDQDCEKYVAIGESDRMTLRFVKPGN